MECIVRQIGDLDEDDRSALERVIGHSLRGSQQVIIQLTGGAAASHKNGPIVKGQLPNWCNIYEGLSQEEIAELERSFIRDHGSRS